MPTKQLRKDRASDIRPPGIGKFGTRLLEISENVVYAGIATFLVGTALVCLVLAGKTTWELTSDFSEQPILDLLDVLLLVFILVEVPFALRPVDRGEARTARRALPAGRHHRLDQGDRRALRGVGEGGRERGGVQRP